jgi:hypothetical protein
VGEGDAWYQCSTAAIESRLKCWGDNEAKTVASLKSQAQSATSPSAKEALNRAATCIESTKNLNTGDDGPKIGFPNEVKACLKAKRVALTAAVKEQDDDFTATEKADTPDAWLAFISKHKDDKRVAAAVKRVVQASTKADGEARSSIEEKLASTYPQGVAELPADRRILVVGPKGLRVNDLVKLKDAKVSPSIVIARVKASPEPYKTFDGEELGALKELGISDEVVTAWRGT